VGDRSRLPRRWRYRLQGEEYFARIVPPSPFGAPTETDLFAGVANNPAQ